MESSRPKFVYFDEDITLDSVKRLIKELEDIGDKTIKLYFSTEGGNIDAMQFLIDYLNSIKENLEIRLTGALFSAGTLLLIYFEGLLDVTRLDVIIFHAIDREQYGIRRGIVDAKTIIKQDIEQNKKIAAQFKEKYWLSEQQVKKYLKGEDVILYNKQIEKWNQLKK